MQSAEPLALEAQLVDLDAKIARALDLAIELEDLEAAKSRLRVLRADRERTASELAHLSIEMPSIEELMPLLRARLVDVEATLRADVARPDLRLARSSSSIVCGCTAMDGPKGLRL